MRLVLIVVGSLLLSACQAPNLPAIPESTSSEELARDDAEVISAAIRDAVVQPLIAYRERLVKNGYPGSPIPQIVVVDRTLRVCDVPEYDPTTCALTRGMRDIGGGYLYRRVRNRNLRSHKIVGPLGSGTLLAPFQRVLPIGDQRSYEQFRTMYPSPTHDGPYYVTAPTHIGTKCYVYILQPQGASWVELERKDGEWIVLRGFGGWVA